MSSEDSGRVIAVWCPIHRQGAVSTTAAMLASYMSEQIASDKTSDKILVMSNIMTPFPNAGEYLVTDRMVDGLNEVVELALSENLRKHSDIYNSTFSGVPRIDILGTAKKRTVQVDFLAQSVSDIFNIARSGYRYIVVDTAPGVQDLSTLSILRNADLVVVCLPQDRFIFNMWVRKMQEVYPSELDNKPVVTVIAQYYDYMHMQYDKMIKELAKKNEEPDITYINLNDDVHKAVSKRDVYSFIKAQKKSANPDCAYEEIEFIMELIEENLQRVIEGEEQATEQKEEEFRERNRKYLQDFGLDDDSGLYGDDEPEEEDESEDTSDEDTSDEDISDNTIEGETGFGGNDDLYGTEPTDEQVELNNETEEIDGLSESSEETHNEETQNEETQNEESYSEFGIHAYADNITQEQKDKDILPEYEEGLYS